MRSLKSHGWHYVLNLDALEGTGCPVSKQGGIPRPRSSNLQGVLLKLTTTAERLISIDSGTGSINTEMQNYNRDALWG